MAGDHSLCVASRCVAAGRVERDDVSDLRSAVEAAFRGDPVRLATARRLVELAAGKGPQAVAALTQLDRMVAASRSGESGPSRDQLIQSIVEKYFAIGVIV